MKVELINIAKEIESLRYDNPKSTKEDDHNQSIDSVLTHLENKYKLKIEVTTSCLMNQPLGKNT